MAIHRAGWTPSSAFNVAQASTTLPAHRIRHPRSPPIPHNDKHWSEASLSFPGLGQLPILFWSLLIHPDHVGYRKCPAARKAVLVIQVLHQVVTERIGGAVHSNRAGESIHLNVTLRFVINLYFVTIKLECDASGMLSALNSEDM